MDLLKVLLLDRYTAIYRRKRITNVFGYDRLVFSEPRRCVRSLWCARNVEKIMIALLGPTEIPLQCCTYELANYSYMYICAHNVYKQDLCLYFPSECLYTHVFFVLISMCIRLKCVKNDFMFRCWRISHFLFCKLRCAAADATTASEKKLLKT